MEKKSKKIAILVDNYFEESEFVVLNKKLSNNGYDVTIISSGGKKMHSMKGFKHGDSFNADLLLSEASSKDYDALVLPGGIFNADQLRVNEKAQAWTIDFIDNDKLVAASSYAPWLLVSADIVEEKKLTSSPTLKDDVSNAGGEWTKRPVVVDGNLITSRGGEDIDKFATSIVDWLDKR